MNKPFTLLFLLTVVAMSGCVTNSGLIKSSVISTRSDIFQEVDEGSFIPQGYSDLRIVSSLKTHKPDIFRFEKKTHGTPDYKIIVNIDGQVTEVAGFLRKENIEPRGLRDPEAGEGIRYNFRKEVRLKAGTHKIVVMMPEDEVIVEKELILDDGLQYSLVLEPVYKSVAGKGRPGSYSMSSFAQGIKGFRMILNGKPQ